MFLGNQLGREMAEPPSGTVTFVFTDIEGSTRRWDNDADAMQAGLEKHDKLLSEIFSANNGFVFKHTGDGMCTAFASARDAVVAAAEVQRVLAATDWGGVDDLRIRVGVHSGEAEIRNDDYFGSSLSRVARLMDAGHGGQILVSGATAALTQRDPGDGLSFIDLGEHRFKDLGERESVYQLVGDGLAADFPRIRSLESVPNNLPEQLTSFVGRQRELSDVIELIAENRLVTLTGVGGVGKTRLAIQAAAESLDDYPDGVFLVELAAIEDPSLVMRTVAESIGVNEQPTRPLLETMLDHLAERDLLIVLDNCEHVINDAAKLCDQILRTGPGAHIVATSREGLAIGGERLWQVPSLRANDGAISDAVQLFVERAQMVRPGFALDPTTEEAVAKICDRLDGIPLAIELATARLKVFSPAQIAERLDDRFRLLTGGSRTAMERQRTLQATMDWSYDLLSELEQALLRRLAVFLGGFTFAAAEEVCSGDKLPEYLSGFEYLSRHASLIGLSGKEADKEVYRVLETVRQYGLNKLVEAGESDGARLRHAQYFAGQADEVNHRLLGDEYRRSVAEIDADHDNYRAGMTWALEHGHERLALRTAAGLGRFWFFRAHYREGRACSRRLFCRPNGTHGDRTRVDRRHRASHGRLRQSRGDQQ